MSRRQQVVDLLSAGHPTFDDDEIAARLDMDRHYVNQVYRRLPAEGLVDRYVGRNGKLVSRLIRPGEGSAGGSASARSGRRQDGG